VALVVSLVVTDVVAMALAAATGVTWLWLPMQVAMLLVLALVCKRRECRYSGVAVRAFRRCGRA
jgi:hypothetical protein